MKKILIGSLLVLLTICLFVACSSSPKDEELSQSVSFYGKEEKNNKLTFNVDGTGTFYTAGGEAELTFNFDDGLNVSIVGVSPNEFFKDKSSTKITSFEELISLSEIHEYFIYGGRGDWFTYIKK